MTNGRGKSYSNGRGRGSSNGRGRRSMPTRPAGKRAF